MAHELIDKFVADGTVLVGGERVPFAGGGLREHTRGARDFTVFTSHVWAWANFPSGRGFILLQLLVGGEYLTRAVLLQDGVLTDETMSNRPLLSCRAECNDPYAGCR